MGRCCQACQILNDTFDRPNSVTNVGGVWRRITGDPQIHDNTLLMSVAGSSLAWLGGFSTFMGLVVVKFLSIAPGTVFRLYMGVNDRNTIPTTNYIEYTYHPYPGPPQSTLSVVTSAGTVTHTMPEDSDGGDSTDDSTKGFNGCMGQVGSAFQLLGMSGDPGNTPPYETASPVGSGFILQLVSSSADVEIDEVLAYDSSGLINWFNTPNCPGCNSSCGCDGKVMSATVAGVPSLCGDLNGAYTLPQFSGAPGQQNDGNKCLWGNGPGIYPDVNVTFWYNPATNITTVLGTLTGTETYTAKITGPVTCADLVGVVLNYTSGKPDGEPDCVLKGSTITITAVT